MSSFTTKLPIDVTSVLIPERIDLESQGEGIIREHGIEEESNDGSTNGKAARVSFREVGE